MSIRQGSCCVLVVGGPGEPHPVLAHVELGVVRTWTHDIYIYSVSGLSCPEAEAYLTVIFQSFLHNNNMNSDYILGVIIYFTPHGNCSSYF